MGIILSAMAAAGDAGVQSMNQNIAQQNKSDLLTQQSDLETQRDAQRSDLETQKAKALADYAESIKNAPLNRAGDIIRASAGEQVPDTSASPQQPASPNGTTPSPDKFNQLVAAISNVESGGNPNASSPQGASGSMQIMPATFKQYAKPGESYSNDADRTAAAVRKLQDDYSHFGGDIAKTAAAYIGGRGAVTSNGSIRDDVADSLGTTPAAYAQKVMSRIDSSAPSSVDGAQLASVDTDAANAPPEAVAKMRDRTPSESLAAAYSAAMASGDLQAAAAIKSMLPDKTLKVGKDESIVSALDPSHVIFSNTAGSDRERLKIEADRSALEVKGRQEAILKAMQLDPLGVNAPPGGYMKALSGGVGAQVPSQDDSSGTIADRLQGKTGDAALNELPPPVANRVKAILDGRESFPSTARSNPRNAQLLDLAAQVDPDFDAVNFNKRNQTATAFAKGKQGDAVRAANQAIAHAGSLYDSIEKLDNFSGAATPLNYIVNPAEKLFGDSRQGVFQQKAVAVASELRKVFSGSGGGSLSELKEWQDGFPVNASQTAQKAYLMSGMELLHGAVDNLQTQYENGMGKTAGMKSLITPKSQAILDKINGQVSDVNAPIQMNSVPGKSIPGPGNPNAPRPSLDSIFGQ